MGRICTLEDTIDMMRRRVRLLLVLTAIGVVYSILLALSQPQNFRSSEVIQITRPANAGSVDGLVAATISTRQLQQIEQRLMTRRNLLEIIEAFNLFSEHPDMKAGALVTLLRQAVIIGGIAATRNDADLATLSITVELPTALQAQQVAAEMSRRFITLASTDRIEQARETLNFFSGQENILTAKATRLENQIAFPGTRTAPTRPGNRSAGLSETLVRLAQVRAELAVISARHAEAKVGMQLENQNLAERLIVIEPAPLPEAPLPVARKRIAVIGSFLSVGIALMVAFALDARNPVIRTAAHMQRVVGVGPVVSIPYLDTTPPKVTRWQRILDWVDGPEPQNT